MSQLSPAIFFDRDGTLIEDVHYCKNPADVRVLPGVLDALRKLKSAGFRHIIITNQSAIGRGYMNESDYDAVHARTLELIGERLLDGAYYCPDAPDRPSTHRKPATGMVFDAAREHALDLSRSWFVGDKAIDVECGRAAGTRTILVLTGRGQPEHGAGADFVARDLADAADFILKHLDASPR